MEVRLIIKNTIVRLLLLVLRKFGKLFANAILRLFQLVSTTFGQISAKQLRGYTVLIVGHKSINR